MDVHFVAGLTAGAATTLVTHPLDVAKIRLQLHQVLLRTLFAQLLVRDWYRGVTPNLIGNVTAWGMYFGMYEQYKRVLMPRLPLDPAAYMALSWCAGLTTLVITNPIWVIKTRMLGGDRHRLAVRLVADMIRTEGVTSLWKGLVPLLFSVGQALLQFTIYDHGKVWVKGRRDTNTTTEHVYLLAFSKVVAMTLMYPAQVIKARLQYSKTRSSLATVIRQVAHERAFYSGISANLVRVVPATTVTFVVYEKTKAYLS